MRPARATVFALFAALLVVTAVPASASHAAVTSAHLDDTDLGAGTLDNAEVERSNAGNDAFVGYDTARTDAVSRWAFDLGSGSTAYDHVGTNDGTITGATWTTGVSGQALDFDGSGDIVDTNTRQLTGSNFTVSAWVNFDNFDSNLYGIVNQWGAGGEDFILQYTNNAGQNQIRLFVDQSNGNNAFAAWAPTINAGEWHHITGVVDGEADELRIYVDGELVATDTGWDGTVSSGGEDLTIGARADGSAVMDGQIDEVRAYDSVLSPGLITRLSRNPNPKISANATERWAGDAGLGETAFGDEGNDGTFIGGGEENNSWPFNEGTGTVAYDFAGSNDGTLNGDTSWVSGISGQALSFDGSNDHVAVGDVITSTDSVFTISIWVNTATSGSQMALADNWDSTLDFSAVRINTGGNPTFLLRDTPGGDTINLAGPTSITDGTWHHVAAVRDGTTAHLYVDGELVDSATNAALDTDTGGVDLHLGESPTGGNDYTGSLDDARVYSSALTPGEVNRLFNEPEVRHNPSATERWALDNGTGTTAFGDEGEDGTFFNSPTWTDGIAGNSLDFNAGNSEGVEGTSPASHDIGTGSYTITAWVNPDNCNSGDGRNTIFHQAEAAGPLDTAWLQIVSGTTDCDADILLADDDTSTSDRAIGGPLPLNSWSLVTAVYDTSAGELRLYVNETEVADDNSLEVGEISGFTEWAIGKRAIVDERYFDGEIDEVRIYNDALTTTDISRLYNDPTSQIGEEHYGDEWTAGQSGQAMQFEGNSEYVSVPDDNSLDSDTVAVSFWMNTTATDDSNMFIVSKEAGSPGWRVFQRNFNNDVRFQAIDGGSDSTSVTSTTTINDGSWHFITAIHDNSTDTAYLYVDGVLEDTDTNAAVGSIISSHDVTLAARSNGDLIWNGTLDDVRIYDRNLSASDVQWLFDHPGEQLNDTGSYTGAAHDAENSVQGFTDLTLDNATATVTWLEVGGSTLNTTSFTTSGNKTLTWSESSASQVEVDVEFEPTDPVHMARLHDEGAYSAVRTPEYDAGSADPDSSAESVSSLPVTLSIDVSDGDLPTSHGDSVGVEFFVDGSSVGDDALGSNGTASTTTGLTAGAHTWHVNLSDSWAHSVDGSGDQFDVVVPSELTIFNETNHTEVVDDANATVEFYFDRDDAPDLIVTRDAANGTINMTGLPAGEPFVVTAAADGYFTRRIFVPSLAETQSLYLLNENETAVQPVFELTDFTGQFPLENTVLAVQRNINSSWVTVEGDFFGAANELPAQLEFNVRHRLVITNILTNRTRELGAFTPVESGTVDIEVFTEDVTIVQNVPPAIAFLPGAGSVPAANVTIGAAIQNRSSTLTAYNVEAVLDDGSPSVLFNLTGSQPSGEELSQAVNLTGEAGSSVTLRINWTLANGDSDTRNVTYFVRETFNEQFSLITILEDLPGRAADGTGDALRAFIALLVTAVAVAYSADRMTTEAASLVGLGSLGFFMMLDYVPFGWFFAAAVAWAGLTAFKRRL